MSLIENTTQLSQSVLFQESLTMYGAFGLFTLVLVALDIYQTRGGAITMQKAIVWSIFWFLLAFLFAGSIYFFWDVYAPHSAYSNEKATV
ncbi:hypothetical protein P3697_29155, partial [Vibrio parahaemolyticus]|nr:hypothetical protein [Vibrio parahaemolyticus]